LNFPLENAFDIDLSGSIDAFITKLNATGDSLRYSSYLGGISTDFATSIDIDQYGKAYITGNTKSISYPTKIAYDNSFNGDVDALITCIGDGGDSLVYSTYIGASFYESGYGIVVDTGENAFIGGYTSSLAFPTVNPIQDTSNGQLDIFLAKMAIDEFICFDSDGDGFDDRTEVNNKTNPNCPEGQDCIQTGIYNSSSATTEPQTITSATIPTNITSPSLPSTQAAVLQQAFGATPDVAVLRQTLLLGATDEDKAVLNSLSDAQLLQLYNQMINGQSDPAAQ